MRIIWNNERFEAELTPGELWRDDKDAIQNAGFRTDGPPDWKWFTTKAYTLNKLRQNRPKSGLTLTEVALSHYKQINEQEEKKLALKKQYQQLRREANKQSLSPEISGLVELVIPAKGYIDRTDLPPMENRYKTVDFVKPDVYCIVCGDPLYGFPDYPDICLWCKET